MHLRHGGAIITRRHRTSERRCRRHTIAARRGNRPERAPGEAGRAQAECVERPRERDVHADVALQPILEIYEVRISVEAVQ